MRECRVCNRTIYTAFGDSLCQVCRARHAFEDIRDQFRQGKVGTDLYAYYLDQFNKALNGEL